MQTLTFGFILNRLIPNNPLQSAISIWTDDTSLRPPARARPPSLSLLCVRPQGLKSDDSNSSKCLASPLQEIEAWLARLA